MHFGKRGKLNSGYVGPFEITECVGSVAYRLKLPDEMGGIHDVFHVSQLKKCLSDETLVIPFKELTLNDKLRFVEEPVEIMDYSSKETRLSKNPIVKVRWNSKHGEHFTWEREDVFKEKYPHLFPELIESEKVRFLNFGTKFPLTGG